MVLWPFLIAFFVLGTIVGSFSNVVVLRHGFKEAARARSGCAACAAQLKWYELVPIVSFVALRGRCRSCGSALSLQYPLVESLLGFLFAGTLYLFFPFFDLFHFVLFFLTLLFWTVFLILTVYDLKHTLVPYVFSFSLITVAFLIRIVESIALMNISMLIDAFFGALIFGGFLFALFLLTRGNGMGLGDAHVGIALGMFFGAGESLDVLALSFWIGAGIGIVLLILKKGFKMKTEVPFVPFLFLASVIGAFTSFSAIAFIGAVVYGL